LRILDKIFICCITLFFFNSCKEKNTIQSIQNSPSVFKKPYIIGIKNPESKTFSKHNPPQKITIPVNKSIKTKTFYDSKLKIQNLSPPEKFTPSGGISGGLSHFNTYSTDNGLVLSSVACGYRDSRENLWFGTYGGGVSKFNGKLFVNYNSSHGLSNNLVLCILEDRLGNIWFGTQGGGVSKYDGYNFTTYNITNGLADNVIYSILEDKKGTLWFATKNGGVSVLDPNTKDKKMFKNINSENGLSSNTIRTLYEDWHGNIWIGTEGAGVDLFDGQKFKNYNTKNGLSNNTIWCINGDKTGTVWLGTKGSGVMSYNGKRFMIYDTTQGLANNTVWAIQQDKGGNIWFGTEGGGISVLNNTKNHSDELFTSFNTNHGLANNVVFSITEDSEGNIWFGTYGGGLSRYNGNSFVTFNSKQGLASNVVFSINEDINGNLWFGSYAAGVSKYDGKSFVTYNSKQGLPNNTVWCITPDSKGNIWFGTYGGGISKFDGSSFINYTTTQGLSHDIVRCAVEDDNGNIWIGTEGGGVSKFDGKSFVNYTTDHGLPHNIVRTIYKDKIGNLWLGTEGGGICKYNGKQFVCYTNEHGLINNVVRSICEDHIGNIYIATQGGLSVLNPKTHKILNFTISDGLPDNYVTQVLLYPNGKIAIGTNNGIALFNSKKSIEQKKLVDLELYNSTTNYPVKDVNVGQYAMFVDSKGIIWAGTGDDKTSLVRMDYKTITHNPKPPVIAINSIKLNENIIDWISLEHKITDSLSMAQSQMYNYGKILSKIELDSIKLKYNNVTFDSIERYTNIPKHLILPYEHNSISIDFNAVEPSKHFMVNYQYMLAGYDKTWSPILKKTEASFGNINEGEYVFKVRAQGPGGTWSEPISYHFKVLAPWYRTIWAYISYILLSIGVLYSFVKWRTHSLKQKQKELELIVEQRTTEVTHQKDLVQEKQKEILDSINYARRIQYTLLANDEFLKQNLPHHFILFKPKDIVSGDFYWATEHQGMFFFAICDSTGHGVPGAFMSLLNISYLNEAIKERNITQPGEIFNYVRNRLIESISKDDQQDGMDGILIRLDISKNNNKNITLHYAAANNTPIAVVNNYLIEYSKNKMPIGKGEKQESFNTYTIEISKGSMLYLYTDGYADQFGGEKGKKFKYKQLNELLLSVSNKTLQEQKEILNSNIEKWKGDLEQVDDICLVGIKL
jgi:ligand-binding sensor domain-containing protein/serine phosphatase RsbU (regulator of sigma subunit)